MLMPRACVYCGLTYHPVIESQRFCSPSCRADAKRLDYSAARALARTPLSAREAHEASQARIRGAVKAIGLPARPIPSWER